MLDKEQIRKVADLGKKFSTTTISMHEAIAKRAGLTGTDHKYLGMLLDAKQMTAGELSKASGLTTGAVTGLIDRLEKKGFVKREFLQHDRRKVIIVANDKRVHKMLKPSFDLLQGSVVKLVETFTDREMLTVEKYLHHAIAVMEDVKKPSASQIESVKYACPLQVSQTFRHDIYFQEKFKPTESDIYLLS